MEEYERHIHIIPKENDGRELKRERQKHKNTIFADGKNDAEILDWAIDESKKSQSWSIPPEDWERIFRGIN